MKYFPHAMIALLTVSACDDNNDSAQVASLTETVEALQVRIATLEADLAVANASIQDNATALTPVNELMGYVRVDANGDVLFEGANVYVQNGGGSTDFVDGSGKGNLIVGYNELRMEGTCSGGANDGLDCENAGECPGGTCDVVDVSVKSGSHNLIVGVGHTYESHSGIVGGANNSAVGIVASGAFVVGSGNRVTNVSGSVAGGASNAATGSLSSVAGGSQNVASGGNSTILGGTENAAEGTWSVVVGGQQNTASATAAIVP